MTTPTIQPFDKTTLARVKGANHHDARVTSFKIEKDIPLPKNAGGGRRAKYPFRQMEIGDSFRVESNGENSGAIVGNVRSAATYFSIRNKGFHFSVCADGNGARVWRTKGGRGRHARR